MKHFSLALLALAAGSVAQAQSNVTVYGRVDVTVRKNINSSVKEVASSDYSRLGFKGTEDLGGGLKAFFDLDHRFFADTGVVDSVQPAPVPGTPFWKGASYVGLSGDFGQVQLGRMLIPTFALVQNVADPFGGASVGSVRGLGMMVGSVDKLRVNGAVSYQVRFGDGFTFGASIAQSAKNGGPDAPTSAALQYRNGPLLLAAGFENPAGTNDQLNSFAAAYTFGGLTLSAGMGDGKLDTGAKARSYLLGANYRVGANEFKAGYAKRQFGGVTNGNKVGVGYYYYMSKRTVLLTDVGYDSKVAGPKTGFDAGIRHDF
jgi:predicted porin